MHRDSVDRFEVQTIPTLTGYKRLGAYLIEAGLINEAQVKVALNDQQATGMKFGEVLATRGWIKQKTIEYLRKKIIVPERKAVERKAQKNAAQARPASAKPPSARVSTVKTVPIEQQTLTQRTPVVASSRSKPQSSPDDSSFTRRSAPITKPLPSVSNPNDDVSWVG